MFVDMAKKFKVACKIIARQKFLLSVCKCIHESIGLLSMWICILANYQISSDYQIIPTPELVQWSTLIDPCNIIL